MALYLTKVSYTSEAWASMIAAPTDRSKVIAKACKSLGGKLVGLWFAMGDCDVVVIVDMPDSVSSASLLMAVAAGGSCKSVASTQLLSEADALKAMAKVRSTSYTPVGKK